MAAPAWTDPLYSSMTIETAYTAARDQLKTLMDQGCRGSRGGDGAAPPGR